MNFVGHAVIAAALVFSPATFAAGLEIQFVNRALTTGLNDGSSWANAHRGPGALSAALAAVVPGTNNDPGYIFVAQGTYYPSTNLNPRDSFEIPGGVHVYGGFVGGENWFTNRPSPGDAPTVLSGDLAQDDANGFSFRFENSRHVVRSVAAVGASVIDGFTIAGGFAADPTSPLGQSGGALLCEGRTTVRGCRFVDNFAEARGGAISSTGVTVVLTDCQFESNRASQLSVVAVVEGGGAIYHHGGLAIINRCRFDRNVTTGNGGAIWLDQNARITNSVFLGNFAVPGSAIWLDQSVNGAPRIEACTFTENEAGLPGGYAIEGTVGSSDPVVSRSILWGNVSLAGGPGALLPGLHAENSIVEGGLPGPGVLDEDPLFVDPVAEDLTLQAGSPALDVASSSQLPVTAQELDLSLRRRNVDDPTAPNTGPNGGTLDLGAFERTSAVSSVRLNCTTIPNSTGQSGRLDAYGSASVATNALTLSASSIPMNTFGFFIVSPSPGFLQSMGGTGNICMNGPIGRFAEPGQIKNSGPAGEIMLTIDLTAIPSPFGFQTAQAGEQWYFQAWHRDIFPPTGQYPLTNLTDASSVVLTP